MGIMGMNSRPKPFRKLIDLDESVKKTLSIKAATEGTNLKKYIENLCIKDSKKK